MRACSIGLLLIGRVLFDRRCGVCCVSLCRCRKVSYPRDLPQISLIFIFVNEALSVILRSVHSAVNHTPAHLLKDIILVDDNSDDGQ